MDFNKIISTTDYDFLRSHPNLGDRTMLLVLGGSHAYGTNNENSDIDLRGCTMERKEEIIGFSKFEQFIDKDTDTVIYGFNKLVNLLMNCNPNTIEMLGCKPEHYLYLSKEGQLLLDNRKLFLSRLAIKSFSGYALGQLNRMENAIARDSLGQAKKEEHILNSMKSAMMSFSSRYTDFDDNAIKLFVDRSSKEQFETEIFMNIDLKHYPLRDFNGIFDELSNIERLYGKLNHRNKKKDEMHVDKHAMHLIRLFLMAIDIYEKEEIVTHRLNDLILLMKIRNGYFRNVDGTYHSSFFDMLKDFQGKLEYASVNTSLPAKPDVKRIEEIVMHVNKQIVLY